MWGASIALIAAFYVLACFRSKYAVEIMAKREAEGKSAQD